MFHCRASNVLRVLAFRHEASTSLALAATRRCGPRSFLPDSRAAVRQGSHGVVLPAHGSQASFRVSSIPRSGWSVRTSLGTNSSTCIDLHFRNRSDKYNGQICVCERAGVQVRYDGHLARDGTVRHNGVVHRGFFGFFVAVRCGTLACGARLRLRSSLEGVRVTLRVGEASLPPRPQKRTICDATA